MLQEVVLPRLGQTVEKATIDKWRVREGDLVNRGDVLLEITTDKATLEVESFVTGTVLRILAQPGEEVEVNAVVAYVGDPKADKAPEPAPKPARPPEPAQPAEKPADKAAAAPVTAPPAPPGKLLISPRARLLAEQERLTTLAIRGTGPGGRIVEADVAAYAHRVAQLRVSPTARVVAFDRAVDLLAVQGTGPGGRIMKEDVERAPSLAAHAALRRIETTPARRIIAERMSRSKREAPHFYLQLDIDMTGAVAFRQKLAAAGTKVAFHDLIIQAVGRGLEAVPALNVLWSADAVLAQPAMDVSLAVALDDGLVTPVIRGAERLSLEQIADQSARLVEKARSHRLAPFEYEGGSVTVTNLGMFGIDNFIPIINPGQPSILGVGRIADRAVVVNGGLAVRKMMSVTLAVDHRVADGATAARFLKTLKDSLEALKP